MKRVLLLGSTGQLGWELNTALRTLVLPGDIHAPSHHEFDLTNPDNMRAAIRALKPDAIINAAGYTRVDAAEGEAELVHQVNAVAPGVIAEEAARLNALLVHYSTDYVFNGAKSAEQGPYNEDDTPNPLNTYGQSKLAGEQAVRVAGGAHLILRASWIYSDRGSNFVLSLLRLARDHAELRMVNDQVGSPSWARALAHSTVEILARVNQPQYVSGVFHLSAGGHVTRYEFAQKIIEILREIGSPGPWARLSPIPNTQYALPAARPLNAATSKAKVERTFGVIMPPWQEQIRAYLMESKVVPHP